jgi:hypothetical protein
MAGRFLFVLPDITNYPKKKKRAADGLVSIALLVSIAIDEKPYSRGCHFAMTQVFLGQADTAHLADSRFAGQRVARGSCR